mgnify:CR=1 FL=1
MSGIDLDPHGNAPGAGMDRRGNRAQGLSEHDVCSAVKDADYLGVAFHRHRRDGTFSSQLEKLDAHFSRE